MVTYVNCSDTALWLSGPSIKQEVAPGATVEVSEQVAAELDTQPQYWQPVKAAKPTTPADAAPAV